MRKQVFELDGRAVTLYAIDAPQMLFIQPVDAHDAGLPDAEIEAMRDIALRAEVNVQSAVALPKHYDKDSIFMDILTDPHAAAVLKPLLDSIQATFAPSAEEADKGSAASEAISAEMNLAMLQYMPLRGMLSFGGDENSAQMVEQILTELNKA